MSLISGLTGRWVAGQTIEDAVSSAKTANGRGLGVLFNYMGEHYRDKRKVERVVGIYLELLENIRAEKLRAGISLKLSEIGLEIGKGYCVKNFLEIAGRVEELGTRVWIDMEAEHFIQDTIDIYLDCFSHFKNISITIQANLERSLHDMKKILEIGGRIRLVKGAYKGDFGKEEVGENFSRLMRILFSSGNNFAIGTHDEGLLREAQTLQLRYSKKFEFQFLMGVKEKLQAEMAKEYEVFQYMPFGSEQLPYIWRRIKEQWGI